MKRPTQVDVAKKAGVSRATVSYIINGQGNDLFPISEETRQRVLTAVEELGYVPDARAQSLRSGDTNTIGLVIPDIRNPHFWELVEGIEQEARASGYKLLLSDTALNDEYAEDIFKDLSRRRIDGLIMNGVFIDQSEKAKNLIKKVLKRRLPIVELNDHSVDYNVDFVMSDYRAATTEVMSHLLSLGHRRIGMIFGVASAALGEDRLQPYQASLLEAGLPIYQELIAKCGPTIEDGYQAALRLLKLPTPPTALIAINDLLAIGAYRAAWDLGLKIPKDLSLVGYDDIQMSKYLAPPLTTVSKDAFTIGQVAVRLLMARIEEPDRSIQKVEMPGRLIVRESTGPVPTL
jgi:LacI family transcriptional regulator